jgi:polysaccharide biosynthesis protein PslG
MKLSARKRPKILGASLSASLSKRLDKPGRAGGVPAQAMLQRRPFLLRYCPAVAVITAVLVLAPTGAAQAPTAPTPGAPGYVGMVSQDTFAAGKAYRVKQLKAMRAAGVTLIRQVFDWASIEIHRGTYSFSAYDPVVAAAARDGIQIMPILFDPPSYLSARPRHSRLHGTYPPKNLASIAAFARAAALWYGPNGGFWKANPTVPPQPITIWQIWNEPNLSIYWLPKSNAAQYVSLLKSADQAILAVDPQAEVVSAGMPLSTLPGIPLFSYIRDMLNAGAASWMNTLGVNPYAPKASGVISILQKVRTALNADGGSQIAIRATEFGWSDNGPGGPYKVNPAGQATQITQVISDFAADSQSLDLRGFVYFGWRDQKPYAGRTDFWGLHTGLLKLNGKPKPALAAFSAAANAL